MTWLDSIRHNYAVFLDVLKISWKQRVLYNQIMGNYEIKKEETKKSLAYACTYQIKPISQRHFRKPNIGYWSVTLEMNLL